MDDHDNNQQSVAGPAPSQADSKEWRLIEKMLTKSLDEQAKARRWGIFFKILIFVYLFLVLLMVNPWNMKAPAINGGNPAKPHAAVVDINGMIMSGGEASADRIVTGLRKAFEEPNAKGIIIRVNSPGGSPVQAGFVYDEINRLRSEFPDKKVYAAITDIGASGAYYISAAADEIYADEASLVGSIGVISDGFGFVEIMEKIGVERRLITAGESKAMLDPFSPVNEEHREFFEGVLEIVHQQFIDAVKQGRGDRLKSDDKLFSGLIWTGQQAMDLGLIDGLGSPGHVARDVVGQDNIVNYTVQPSPFERLVNQFSVSFSNALAEKLSASASLK